MPCRAHVLLGCHAHLLSPSSPPPSPVPPPAEDDLRPIFEPFGALDFVTLQRDQAGNATGIGFVQ